MPTPLSGLGQYSLMTPEERERLSDPMGFRRGVTTQPPALAPEQAPPDEGVPAPEPPALAPQTQQQMNLLGLTQNQRLPRDIPGPIPAPASAEQLGFYSDDPVAAARTEHKQSQVQAIGRLVRVARNLIAAAAGGAAGAGAGGGVGAGAGGAAGAAGTPAVGASAAGGATGGTAGIEAGASGGFGPGGGGAEFLGGGPGAGGGGASPGFGSNYLSGLRGQSEGGFGGALGRISKLAIESQGQGADEGERLGAAAAPASVGQAGRFSFRTEDPLAEAMRLRQEREQAFYEGRFLR